MPTVTLPQRPNLEQLKQQAKDLRSACQAGDAGALAHVAEHYPGAIRPGPVKLSTAQSVIASHYGFTSWAALKGYVEMVTNYTREPDRVEPLADQAEELLRLACLNYA